MLIKTLVPLVLLASLAGCGAATTPAADGGTHPDTAVSNTPGASQPSNAGPMRVEPHEGLVDPHATSFDRFRVRAGGHELDLFFWSGVEECYGVDHVEIDYAKKAVKVTIVEGREPEADACIELAVRKVIRVDLAERLGKREVIDGGASD
jgi:hypothetical protein